MKITTNEDVFILPDNGIHLMIGNGYEKTIIECLISFLNQKKKTKCIIYDQDGDMVDVKHVGFIYVSKDESVDSWFDFKSKTLFNTELTGIIAENIEMFSSIDAIRSDVKSLLTDKGMYLFRKILMKDIAYFEPEMTVSNYDVAKVLQLLKIETECMTKSEKYMMIYNFLLHLQRKLFNIVWVDFPVTNEVYEWLLKKDRYNSLFLLNNEYIVSDVKPIFDSAIILSNQDYMEPVYVSVEQTGMISYLFHPFIQANLRYQKEENLSFLNDFSDKSVTFFLRFMADNMSETL